MNPRGVAPTGLAGRRPSQARRPRHQTMNVYGAARFKKMFTQRVFRVMHKDVGRS